MTEVQIIPGQFKIDDPTWPRYAVWRAGEVYTSDTFDGYSGDPIRQVTDAALGGYELVWESDFDTTGFRVVNGSLRMPGKEGPYGVLVLDVPSEDFTISYRLVEYPTAGSIEMFVRRDTRVYHPDQSILELFCNLQGGLSLYERHGGTLNRLTMSAGPAQIGDTVGLRVIGDTAYVLINGSVADTATTTVTGAGYAGFRYNNGEGGVVDDLIVSAAVS